MGIKRESWAVPSVCFEKCLCLGFATDGFGIGSMVLCLESTGDVMSTEAGDHGCLLLHTLLLVPIPFWGEETEVVPHQPVPGKEG